MFVFSVVMGYERNQAARNDLIARATTAAELATRILRQAGVESERITIFNDTLTGRQLNERFRGYLEAVPDYLFVLDSGTVLYSSAAVQRLSRKDLDDLTTAAIELPPRSVATYVTLDSLKDQVLLAGGFEVPRAAG